MPITARDRWLTLLAALLGWAFDGFEMGVFPVIAHPAIKQLLGAPATPELIRQWIGTMSIAFLLGAAAGGVIFGRLGDRVGRVRAMAFAVLTYSGLTGLSAFANSPEQLAGMRFLAALGMGGEWALGVALVVETWPATARPWLAGLIGAAVNLGYVGVATLKWCAGPSADWRMLLGICALPALLTFFLRLFVPESQRWQTAAQSTAKPRVVELFTPQFRALTLLGSAAGGLVLVVVWGAIQFTQPWADQMSPGAGAKVQMVSAGVAAIGAFLAPVLLANVSRRLGYFLLSAAALASAQFLFLAHDRFDSSFLWAVALAGLFTGAFNGFLPLYLPELFPTRLRATGQGTCYNSGRVLAAASLWYTSAQLNAGGNYPRVCAMLAMAYAIGMILAWFLPETAGQDLE